MSRAALLLLLGIVGPGCESCGCGDDDAIAELADRDGTVERDTVDAPQEWTAAAVGARFRFEEAIRTGPDGTASVELVGGANLDVEPDTVVRFLRGVPNQPSPGVDVETGQAIIEAGQEPVAMRTQAGRARVDPGTRLRVSADGDGVRYEVLIGRAEIEHGEQEATLAEGEELAFDEEGTPVGGAEEAVEADPGSEPRDAGIAEVAADAPIELQVEGRGVRARGPDERRWRRLDAGQSTATAGTTLRLPRGTEVAVRRGDASGTLTGAGVFVIGEEGSLVRAESGTIAVDSGQTDVGIVVPGGTIVVRGGGSRGEASVRGRRGTEVRATRGSVEVRGEDGETQVLDVGETASLRPGGALDQTMVAPERPLFLAAAGSSFTVRDARPPTAVGLRFGSLCPGAGVAELHGRAAHASHGDGLAALAVPAGRHRYTVRCVAQDGSMGEVVADGTIRVLRDAGRTLRPRIPPASVVDTDGRRYTVLYQTLLPQITVRWPRAPDGADGYRLRVESAGSTETITTPRPRHRFESGQLAEGRHQLVFEGGERRSRPTTVLIGFDNAAPTASVASPADGSFAPGDTVRVSGVALEGWSVSVGGTEIPQDAQHRFDAEVAVPPGQDGIAIRLSHPSRGVHYYVRHGAG